MTVIALPDHVLGVFTVADWHTVREQDPDHRYELENGNLIVMSPPKSTHADVITRLTLWLALNGYGYDRIKPGVGIQIGDNGRVPDLVLLREPSTSPVLSYPAEAVLLVVEVVSPSTARVDREVKPGEYAFARIEWFWRIEEPDNGDDASVIVSHQGPNYPVYSIELATTLAHVETMTAREIGLR